MKANIITPHCLCKILSDTLNKSKTPQEYNNKNSFFLIIPINNLEIVNKIIPRKQFASRFRSTPTF